MIKYSKIQFLLWILILFGGALNSSGQQGAGSGESVELFTDRSLYAANEQILFSVTYRKPEGIGDKDWSTVMYVELISWNGSSIARVKVPVRENIACGSLRIPDDLESGNYYLRSYTKWMRNFPQYDYAYLNVKIINPKFSRTEKGPLTGINPGRIPANDSLMSDKDFLLIGIHDRYGKREEVTFDLGVLNDNFSSPYTLSVARLESVEEQHNSFSFESSGNLKPELPYQYYPEIGGLSMSGKIIEKNTNEAPKSIRMNLSTVNNPLYFSSAMSDSEGTFIFTFPPLHGEYEFHLANEEKGSGEFELLIDRDFCNRPVSLPYIPFRISDHEKKAINDLVINAQLQENFNKTDQTSESDTTAIIPFYGKATRTIYEKEFIELKNLEEFFFELVYEVAVKHTNGISYFDMSSTTSLSSYPPLVLMDNIPVRDISELLTVATRRVERIELVNTGYVVGDFMHEGIISMFSETKDMAGLELGDNSNFFTLKLFADYTHSTPEYDKPDEATTIPDRRNTLLWIPDLKINGGEKKKVSFFTGDAEGEYVVNIQGFDATLNAFVYKQKVFTVE